MPASQRHIGRDATKATGQIVQGISALAIFSSDPNLEKFNDQHRIEYK
ncbi:hypothetical protein [Sphingobium sp. MK2]